MAEAGDPLRIRRGLLSRYDTTLYKRSSERGHTIGSVVLDGIREDDNLPTSIAHMLLPVLAEHEGDLLVPTWCVAATLAIRAEKEGDMGLKIDAATLGSNSDAALVVPRERVAIFEPL